MAKKKAVEQAAEHSSDLLTVRALRPVNLSTGTLAEGETGQATRAEAQALFEFVEVVNE